MSTVPPSPDALGAGATGPVPVGRTRAGTLGRTSRLPARPTVDERPPDFHQKRRRTRLWMVLLLITPVVLAVISLLSFTTSGPAEPTVEPLHTPPGYYGVTDADFGYAVPNGYHQNTAWTDQDGDFFYGEPAGFVAETLEIAKRSPTASTIAPGSLRSFGEPDPVAYAVSGGHRIRVPGTAYAWEETITRPGGYHAVALDVWERDTSTEMWLLVRSSASTTSTVVSSLTG